MKRTLMYGVALSSTIFSLLSCAALFPPTYSAEAIEARIVDIESKRPIEGVVVTANWELRSGSSPGGSTAAGELMVMEAVTDKSGRFFFPAWGPISQFKGELHSRDPQLIIFRRGYQHQILSNKERFTLESIREPVRRSDWNGKTIELRPFKGSVIELVDRLSSLKIALRFIEDDCNWKKTPKMILALDRQVKELSRAGITVGLYSLEYLPGDEPKCGSVRQFFEGYRP